jgi:hypothetical protein
MANTARRAGTLPLPNVIFVGGGFAASTSGITKGSRTALNAMIALRTVRTDAPPPLFLFSGGESEMTSRPERPSLPALKVGAPNSSPSAGQIVGERRAREIRMEDPRRTFFRLQHLLSIVVPNSAEKFIDEFQNEFQMMPEVPEITRRLMVEAIDKSLSRLKRIEAKLERLRSFLLSKTGGEER